MTVTGFWSTEILFGIVDQCLQSGVDPRNKHYASTLYRPPIGLCRQHLSTPEFCFLKITSERGISGDCVDGNMVQRVLIGQIND